MAAGGCSSPGNVSQQLEGSSKSAKARAVRVNSGAVSTWQGWASGGGAHVLFMLLQLVLLWQGKELLLPQGTMATALRDPCGHP